MVDATTIILNNNVILKQMVPQMQKLPAIHAVAATQLLTLHGSRQWSTAAVFIDCSLVKHLRLCLWKLWHFVISAMAVLITEYYNFHKRSRRYLANCPTQRNKGLLHTLGHYKDWFGSGEFSNVVKVEKRTRRSWIPCETEVSSLFSAIN